MAQDVGFKKTAETEHQYSTGMHRDNRLGKGALHWLPFGALWLVSTIYEHGNKGRSSRPNKDGKDRNWENGGDIDDFYQSALNHITDYLSGDRSEAHIPQAIWNLLNGLQMSIWVYLGFRSKDHNNLVDHRHGWKPGDPAPCPLAPIEIERLKFKGIIPKDYEPQAAPLPAPAAVLVKSPDLAVTEVVTAKVTAVDPKQIISNAKAKATIEEDDEL